MHAIIIIPAVHLAAANQAAQDQEWGPDNFTVGLNATGSMDDPATHYMCAPEVHGNNWQIIQALAANFPGTIADQYDLDSDSGYPQRRLSALGLKVRQAALML